MLKKPNKIEDLLIGYLDAFDKAKTKEEQDTIDCGYFET
jgi:hypothetical protein